MFCYQKNFNNPTLPVDEAQFWALVRATRWNESIDKYRETHDAALKRKLPAFIFQATFDETESKKGRLGAWRKQAATRLTGLVVMDIDHVDTHPLSIPSGGVIEKPEPQDYYNVWRETHPELFSNQSPIPSGGVGGGSLLLIYITPSGQGLKIVFKARTEWGNLIDNQHQMAKLLGVEVDESCKDASRMSFICKESDILYLDKELFTYENKAFAERYNALYQDGHSQATREDYSKELRNQEKDVPKFPDSLDNKNSSERTFKGIPYADIISAWWQHNGGEPQEGERNVKLYQLAVSLRAICDNNRELLMEIMPRLGLDEQELRSIVESACKEPPKGLSKNLQSILAMVNGPLDRRALATNGTQECSMANGQWSMENVQLERWGEQIEEMMADYPILIDICKGLKRNQYPASADDADDTMHLPLLPPS